MAGRVEVSQAKGSSCGLWAVAAVLVGIAGTALAAESPKLPSPEGLNIRIVGTASFQGRQTALIEDLNTRSDSFYRVGDPIYGFEITAITADGIVLERDGEKSQVAFETSAGVKSSANPPSQMVAANTYLSPDPIRFAPRPNFYSDPNPAALAAKIPAMAGTSLSRATAAAGRFLLPLATYKRMSSGFGYRKHPIGGGSKMHKGIDLAANRGTRIVSADSGTVTFSGWKGGYGYCIIVSHHNGYETLYGHCSKLIADVGDNVRRGDLIAEVGSTGASTGNHLHFEVHKNKVAIDPEPFISDQL